AGCAARSRTIPRTRAISSRSRVWGIGLIQGRGSRGEGSGLRVVTLRLSPCDLTISPCALRLAPSDLRLAPSDLRLPPCASRPGRGDGGPRASASARPGGSPPAGAGRLHLRL